ncbi:MAG TPA: aminotransferase class V-fold PLP-dependent enzyme, partial [Acidobacteriota bacterium]|nr:aminotransferase class V-fold PLP-dependent enzyme [Acidobacteriota bacterium]
RLSEIPGVKVHDLGRERCGIVTFTIRSRDADDIKKNLAAKKINVTVTTTSSTLLDMQSRNLEELVRASVHYFNTEEEITRFCQALNS